MIVTKVNIPKLLKDNDAAYLNHIEYVIRTIDEEAELTVTQRLSSISFQIIPSEIQLKPFIIKAIRKTHYKLDLQIDFSKSVNASNIISFWTCFQN